jgi:CheY-like chemotaxis protein
MPALILVVDDNEDLRDTMAELLDLEGYAALTASSGKDALAVLSSLETVPDVVLSDWRMPDMDGEALFNALRADARFQQIPFILMGQFQSSREMMKHFPGAHFLDKPFNPDELIILLQSLV